MKPTFLLLTCSVHKNQEVAKEIQKNHGVREAIPVFGTYDCVVETEEMTHSEIRDLITSTIRPLTNVSAILPLYTSSKNIPKPNDR